MIFFLAKMTQAVGIAFWTMVSLLPVPFWHLLLHSFLPVWRSSPKAFYSSCVALWALCWPCSWHLAWRSEVLFVPPDWIKVLCLGVSCLSFGIVLWTIRTLTPRRFFLWVTLHPEQHPSELIVRGPFRFVPHPTYLSIVVALGAGFLASGQAVLLAALVGVGFLLVGVILLEQRELRSRLAASARETPRS